MYGHSNSGRNNTPCGDEKKNEYKYKQHYELNWIQ